MPNGPAQPVFDGNLEIRQVDGRCVLAGRFPYGAMATMSDRGRVRKGSFAPRAFRFTFEQEPERRIDLLVGHDFNRPIASRQAGSLVVEDGPDALVFTATLPEDPPYWVIEAERAVSASLMTGISPGFRVPPRSVVPNAETLIDEPGNPGVQVRQINHALLRELYLVTNLSYEDSTVELRDDQDRTEYLRCLWLVLIAVVHPKMGQPVKLQF